MMAVIQFQAPVVVIRDRAIVKLPADASASLPSRGQVAATGTINGQPFTTMIEPDGRRGHWIDVGADRGDTVTVELEVAKAWPEPHVPADFQVALDGAPQSGETWADITPMARWEWIRWINSTQNPQTRSRRIEAGVDKLHRGMRRPCCFDLSSCTDPELSKGGKLV